MTRAFDWYWGDDWGNPPPKRRAVESPPYVLTGEAGIFGIQCYSQGGEGGLSRAANDIAGYNLYVGVDALPDFTGTPTFAASLPAVISIVPPPAGTKTYNVAVRAQNQYGLESRNQNFYSFTIDTSGNLVLPVPVTPDSFSLNYSGAGNVTFVAHYRNYWTDQYRATYWRVWAGATPPDPLVDIPLAQVAVSGDSLRQSFGPFAPGLLYGAVALYRTTGDVQSAAATASLVVPSLPTKVVPVHGGADL